jgi:hypothetical protein
VSGRPNFEIARRELLRVIAFGTVAATGTASSSIAAERFPDKHKARYRAESADVQTFYRVNRYPAK